MSTPNEDGKQPENTELPKQQASACCGPGCGCGTAGKPSKSRWMVGVIVLAIAGVMVVRGMVKSDKGATQASPAGFADPTATETAAGGADTKSDAAAAVDETTVGTTIGAFAELNTVAIKTDAVFIYLPGKEVTAAKAPSKPMKGAARLIEAKGIKCGLFTLKPGSADYDKVGKQMAVPGVVALVKGRGMSAVSGEITEAKLVQGYVAALSAGGCGSGAGAGCCPK
jgi:MYXO-CTERM domain-containing protein